MPIYEYQCEECGHRMEAFQKITDPQLTTCPACEKTTLKKLVSAAAFQLKGSGWYVTDFKDKKQAKTEKREDDKSGGSGKADSSSDTKSSDAAKQSGKKKSPAASD
ncbi:MAG TPA: zinc ribbon domain-containing protein [Gammaproteobacteria bacterium]|nr:zinc ribbon domain-containing protein [Gammaproteobacteria bacterium]